MKAKVIKTGEIVEVYHETQHGQVSNIYKESVLINGRLWTEDELDFSMNPKSKEANLEKDVRQIISLYYEGIKYYEDIIRKEREENGGSDLVIKIMDGVVNARELSILYVIDKLKAQKGE